MYILCFSVCMYVSPYVRACACVCACVCVCVFLSIYIYVCVSIYMCIYTHTRTQTHTSIYPSINLSVYQPIYLSTCLPIYIYIYPAIYLKTSSIHLKVLNPFLTLGYRVLCLLCQIQEPNTCVGSGNIHEPSVGVVRSTMRDLTLETSFYLACARALSHSLSCGCPTHTPVSRREGRGP